MLNLHRREVKRTFFDKNLVTLVDSNSCHGLICLEVCLQSTITEIKKHIAAMVVVHLWQATIVLVGFWHATMVLVGFWQAVVVDIGKQQFFTFDWQRLLFLAAETTVVVASSSNSGTTSRAVALDILMAGGSV